jgi:hypothetical protein
LKGIEMPLSNELVRVGIPPGAATVIPSGTVAAVTATSSSTQATAVELSAGINRVTGSDGVKLPAANPGDSLLIINDTGSTIKIWPPTGGAIQVPGTSFGAAVVNANATLTLLVALQVCGLSIKVPDG